MLEVSWISLGPVFPSFSFRQINSKNNSPMHFLFPFLLTLNTSINQQLHSVTTIVMRVKERQTLS